MEAHHLIPVSFQSLFEYGIDTMENIISLCPACHKQMHFAHFDGKKELLKELYEKRKLLLLGVGIQMKKEELFEFYG